MLQRLIPELMRMTHVLALNDEAHHCYREKPPDPDEEALEKLKGGRSFSTALAIAKASSSSGR
jgi:hypothetical protein